MAKAKKHRGGAVSLAAVLRDAARDSGLSVYRIAKEGGVDQSTLNKFLNGERNNLRLDVADRLLKFFGLCVIPKE
ncbi:MAG TPA: helix-turn-helix transcriptional regulator [Lacipirellulaceae bacterium]|nr:helix-turn-helix transcriptional regulator [Lacipirellulaceae bacterium]